MMLKHLGFFGTIMILTGLSACDQNTQKLVGKWNASWYTTDATLLAANMKNGMKGKLLFSENGKAVLEAYGYEGCLFAADTLRNEMDWTLKDNTLELVDASGFVMSYQVVSLEEQRAELQLLEDVFIRLEK